MLIALPNAFGDAATNMAIDAALLESIPKGLAAFRHYGWTEPAATFGYAQKHAEVLATITGGQSSTSAAPPAVPTVLVRRLTGGGIVDHRNDWTYALVIESSLAAAQMPATELYEKLHRAISHALATQGIETHLAPCPRACDPASRIPHPASRCFVTPAANDVLHSDGTKIAGAAMKRNRHGLLIQGSIDRGTLPEDFNFTAFQKTLFQSISNQLAIGPGELEDIRPLFKSERIQKEKERFASDTWNMKR